MKPITGKARRPTRLYRQKHRRRKFSASLMLLTLIATHIVLTTASAETPVQGNATAGRHFYRTGLDRQGAAVAVTVRGDVQSNSARFTCMGCHRPSGFGGSEGGEYVPIITQPVLFSPRAGQSERRNRRFRNLFKELHSSSYDVRMRMPRMRPNYTQATLVRAIKDGIDAADRPLSPSMPRYQLDKQTAADITAYLKTLSRADSPGVDDKTLHLATVVSDTVNAAKRTAVVDTMRAFTRWYNEDIKGQITHKGFSPYYRSEFENSFRPWQLHVWVLHGAVDTWNAQLQAYYAKQPAFAVVSGLVDGPWKAVDAFCESQRLPCVFPNTELPPAEPEKYGYSIYFSRGLALEGAAVAKYLASTDNPPKHIRQIRVAGTAGSTPAQAFTQAARHYLPEAQITTVIAESKEKLQAAMADSAVNPTDVLVVWPGDNEMVAINALNRHPPRANMIVLPSAALAAARQNLSPALTTRVRLTFPYEQPGAYHPRQYRVRAWFGSRKVALTYPRLQLQTYYALTMMQYGVADLVNDFNRDYLIEFIEHEAEAELNPGMYPKLALGPGQRFASKGAFIIELARGKNKPDYHTVSDWIVP